MNLTGNDLPLSYRQTEVDYIMQRVCAGESCSLVGTSSTGKSNLFRFLLRQDVKAEYLGDDAEKCLFILLDSHSLSIDGVSEWKVYELALHRLLRHAERLPIESEVIRRFDDLYQRVATSKDALLGQRYLERFLAVLCEQLGYRLFFLFDEFDEIIRDFDRRFFLNLRAIRDEFKYKVMYVVASRDELSRIRHGISEVQAFYELVSLNVHGLKPYNDADAAFMIQRLAKRRGVSIDEAETKILVRATGGHPGILRAAFWAVSDGRINKADDWLEQLLDDAGVWDECLKVWDSLGEDEQGALAIIASGTSISQIPPDVFDLLELKGLVVKHESDTPTVFCSLFKDFVDRQRVSLGRGIKIDKEKAKVWVEGRSVNGLTPLEFKLLSHLLENQGHVCSRDELIAHLYSDEQVLDTGVPDNRVDTIVGRLREKIEPDRSRPRYVITVRGHGYKLAEE